MANHRADTRAGRTGSGRHQPHPAPRPGAHARARRNLLRGRYAAATLVGAAALVLAAAGVVTATPSASTGLASMNLRHSATAATPAPAALTAVAAAERPGRAVSRDLQREARRPTPDARLHAAAQAQARAVRAARLARAKAHARQARARAHARLVAANAWRLPVRHGAYHLTSRFGECSPLWSKCHTGLDFAATTGTPIRAVARGTVRQVGYAGAYGNRTVVRLPDGTSLWYCHQSAVHVRVGQKVRSGQVIGAVGATGNTTGPHLHLEVRPRPKHPVDPFAVLAAHHVKP